jgi:hypothetical protein
VHVTDPLRNLQEDPQDVSLRHVAMISGQSLHQILVTKLHLHQTSQSHALRVDGPGVNSRAFIRTEPEARIKDLSGQ